MSNLPVLPGPIQPTASPNSTLVAAVYNAVAPAPTSGQQVALQCDSNGYLYVNGTTSGGGNAAASATGSAVPASGDYIAFNVSGTLTGVSSANPLPVNIVAVSAANGSGTVGSAAPTTAVLVGGSDGTNLRALLVSATGQLQVQDSYLGGAIINAGSPAVSSLRVTVVDSSAEGYSSAPLLALGLSGAQSSVVKIGAGKLHGYAVGNSGASAAYVFFYDVTSIGTIGSATNLRYGPIYVPAGASGNVMDVDVQFSNGIIVAASTAANGATALSTAIQVTSVYL